MQENEKKNEYNVSVETNKNSGIAWFYRLQKNIAAALIILILFGVCVMTYRIVSVVDAEKIDKAITSFDKTQGSIKRLADYTAVTMRTTNTTMKSIDKLVKDDFPATLNDIRTETKEANKNASLVTRASEKAIQSLDVLVDQKFGALVDDFRVQVNETGELLRTQTRDISILAKKNLENTDLLGQELVELVKNGNAMLAEDGEIAQILKELQGSAKGLNILTNDPNLIKTIANLEKSTYHLSGTSYNIEVITGEGAKLFQYINGKLIEGPPKNFADKYIYRPAVKVFKFIYGTSQLYLVINNAL